MAMMKTTADSTTYELATSRRTRTSSLNSNERSGTSTSTSTSSGSSTSSSSSSSSTANMLPTRRSLKTDTSQLPPCLRLYHEERRRASQESHKPNNFVVPPAFKSCIAQRVAKQQLLKDIAIDASNVNAPSPRKRIKCSLSLKRASWQQLAALRNGKLDGGANQRQTLAILREAAQRVREMHRCTSSSTSLPATDLLQQAVVGATPNSNNNNNNTTKTKMRTTVMAQRRERQEMAIRLQAIFRMCMCRQRYRQTQALSRRSDLKAPLLPPPRTRGVGRHASDITMSEWGDDSMHNNLQMLRSSRHTYRTELSDMNDSFQSLGEMHYSPKTNMERNNLSLSTLVNNSSSHNMDGRPAMMEALSSPDLYCMSPLPNPSRHIHACASPSSTSLPLLAATEEEIRLSQATGNTSFSSYFERQNSISSNDTPVKRPRRQLSPTARDKGDNELQAPSRKSSETSLSFSAVANHNQRPETSASFSDVSPCSRWDDNSRDDLISKAHHSSYMSYFPRIQPVQPPPRRISPVDPTVPPPPPPPPNTTKEESPRVPKRQNSITAATATDVLESPMRIPRRKTSKDQTNTLYSHSPQGRAGRRGSIRRKQSLSVTPWSPPPVENDHNSAEEVEDEPCYYGDEYSCDMSDFVGGASELSSLTNSTSSMGFNIPSPKVLQQRSRSTNLVDTAKTDSSSASRPPLAERTQSSSSSNDALIMPTRKNSKHAIQAKPHEEQEQDQDQQPPPPPPPQERSPTRRQRTSKSQSQTKQHQVVDQQDARFVAKQPSHLHQTMFEEHQEDSPRSVLDLVASRAEMAQQRRLDFLIQAAQQAEGSNSTHRKL